MASKDTNPKDAIGRAKWRNFFVVPMQVIWEIGIGMLEGTLKYGRHNYRGSGVRASVYVDAAIGHIQTFVEGEDIDKESGLSHITKAICSLIVLRDAQMNDFWVDDRPPAIKDLDALRDRLQILADENYRRHADKAPHHYSEVENPAPYRAPRERPCTVDEAIEAWDHEGRTVADCREKFDITRCLGEPPIEYVDPAHEEVRRLLSDPTWLPGPLRALGHLDPQNLERIPKGARGYEHVEVLPGYTWKDLNALISIEAATINLTIKDSPNITDALLRRVMVRLGTFG